MDNEDREFGDEYTDTDDPFATEETAYNPLTALPYDDKAVREEASKEFDSYAVLPEGDYEAIAISLTPKKTKKQGLSLLELKFDVNGTTYSKAYFYDKEESRRYMYVDLARLAPHIENLQSLGNPAVFKKNVAGKQFKLACKVKMKDGKEVNQFYINGLVKEPA